VARLVVSRGAQIFADGTAQDPIIFTAEGDFSPTFKTEYTCESAEVVYVSDLPFENWYNGWGPVERDRANGEVEDDDENPISQLIEMNGKIYEKGIGVHASAIDNPLGENDSTNTSFIRINLNGQYDVFKSDVGPQDTKLVDGDELSFLSIQFRVLVDGNRRYESQLMTPGSRIEYIELDVRGASTLELQVLNGGDIRAKNGNQKSADHGNWGNARLEKCVSPSNPETLLENVDPGALQKSLWGGVVVMGNAPVNTGTSRTMGNLGGDAYDRDEYGGSSRTDNSGRMTYVSIRHGGGVEERKVNGLTLAAVGVNTRVEHIEVLSCYDDGLEICGGTVNTKYMAMAFNGSDGFDIDEGYIGKGQFWFSLQNKDVTQMDESLLEGAFHNGRNAFNNPTAPQVFNATFLGANIRPSHRLDRNFGLFFRDASAGSYRNCIFAELYNGVAIGYQGNNQDSYSQHTQGNLVVSNSMFWDIAENAKDTPAELFLVENSPNQGVSDNFASAFEGGGNTCNSPEFRALNPNSRTPGSRALDPRPRLDGKGFADKGRAIIPNDGFFDTSANYKGAFGADLWLENWTGLDQYGFLGQNGLNPEGTPRLPDLSFWPSTVRTDLDIPQVVGQDTSFDISFTIYNVGQLPADPTKVSFRIGSVDLGDQTIPFLEAGGETGVTHTINLAGISPGTQVLTIEIDPDTVIREGDESNNIYEHEFSILGPPEEKPDIQISELDVNPTSGRANTSIRLSCMVENIGEADAANITATATFGSQALTLSTTSIASIPAGNNVEFQADATVPPATTPGTYEILLTLRLIGEENTGNNSDSVNFVVITNPDGTPNVIGPTADPFHPMGESTDTEASIEVSDASLVEEVKFFSRPISRLDLPFTEGGTTQDGNTYSATFSDGQVGRIGIAFYFEVTATNGEIINSQPGYTHLRYNSGLPLPTIRTGRDRSDYQIVSFPLDLTSNSFGAVFDELEPGASGSKWKFMRYNGNATIDYSGTIRSGEGYWLLSTESVSINSGPGTTVSATPASPYTISLNPGGSDTQIGNPYNFNLSWADILQENGVSENEVRLKTYDGGWDTPDRLDAFEGAFIQNNAGLTQLRIPVQRNASINRLGSPVLPALAENFWYVPIHLESGELVHRVSRLGMHPESAEGFDTYDMRGMPRFDRYLDLNFVEAGHPFKSMSENFVNTQAEYSWDMEIASNLGSPIVISWENTYFGENDRQLWVEDLQTGQVVDMRVRKQMQFYPQAEKSLFRVHFGDWEYVTSQIQSLQPWIEEPFPNPVEDQLVIATFFPGGTLKATVVCELYNLTGERVAEKLWTVSPGKNSVLLKWAFEQEGFSLTEGMYIYRLRAHTSSKDPQERIGKLYFKK
ncbi:MAG: NPCBM/NEW2 domain-containing protein, partial [Bacteroidota bacterium]